MLLEGECTTLSPVVMKYFCPRPLLFFYCDGGLLLLSFCYAVFPRHLKGPYHIFSVCFLFDEKQALQKQLQIFFHLSEELLMKYSEMLLNL